MKANSYMREPHFLSEFKIHLAIIIRDPLTGSMIIE